MEWNKLSYYPRNLSHIPSKLMSNSLVSLLIVFAFLISACQGAGTEKLSSPSDSIAVTDVIAPSDGSSFEGWKGYKSDAIPNSWVIEDGAFHFKPTMDASGKITSERGDIMTVAQYDDFELSLEWKIGECGNSGIFFNVVEADEYPQTYSTAPEMQVLDNTCHPDAKNGPDRFAGANYALHPPSEDSSKPAGEWTLAVLKVEGNMVEHWLNGKKIVEYEMYSDDWKAKVADSKFANFPGYAIGDKGHIALQDHQDPVWFRNIKIEEL